MIRPSTRQAFAAALLAVIGCAALYGTAELPLVYRKLGSLLGFIWPCAFGASLGTLYGRPLRGALIGLLAFFVLVPIGFLIAMHFGDLESK